MRKSLKIDPRTGLALLVLSNVIAFMQNSFWTAAGWIVFLCVVTALCGCVYSAIKWLLAYILLLSLQYYILPASPKFIATSFSILANYTGKMFPCLIVGMLMVKKTPLRNLIVGLRKWHFPQKLIVAISVTLRYFPAIREEAGYIRDAMKLRNIHGLQKVEFLIVPLMISATGTAEELSAAAVTRGIENPAPKTSVVELHVGALDWICIASGVLFTAAGFLAK
jgi:energy-coupling factor transport system permease protein